MVEDISTVISKGFETYTKNLSLSIPFILSIIVNFLIFAIILVGGFFTILGPSMSAFERAESPEEIYFTLMPLISQHVVDIILLVVVLILVSMFIGSFFMAGAIGMAKQATETGRSGLSTMMDAGKKNVMNLFLAEIFVFLLFMAGIIFLVPGAIQSDMGRLFTWDSPGIIFFIAGGLIWALYMLILSIILAVFRYALVVEELGPVEGVFAGFQFFKAHKLNVFIIWIILIAIAVSLAIFDQIMGFIPFINIMWALVSLLINVAVIPALTTVWWVRLYMTGTDKKIYFNEMLAHPNDLKKDENLYKF